MSLKISSLDKTVYKKVIDVISSDGLAIAPTETVYSFIIDIFSVKARDTLYKIKKRNIKKPFIMMANSINIIKDFVNVSNDVLQITEKFWPGQLTLILSTTDIGRILSGGREDLGVRIPENRFMLKLLRKMNRPVFSTSVNISNKASAKNMNDVLEFDGIADIIVDGGKCKFSFESTIVDAVKFPYIIVRKGCLDINEIMKHLLHIEREK